MADTSSNYPTKILYVDDEPKIKDLTLEMFEPEISARQYKFDFARSRTEALKKLEEENYQIQLVDIVMPDEDFSSISEFDNIMPEEKDLTLKSGLVLIKQTKRKYFNLLSGIITGYCNDVEYLKHGYEAGASGFIGKPIDREKLIQFIEQLRGRARSKLPKISNENQSQEKKIRYNTVFKLVRELDSDLNYKLTIESIKRFQLNQFEELRKNLPVLEAQVREEQKRREFLIQKDLEREKQGKFPLLPLIEGAIDTRSKSYQSKDDAITRSYRYLYLRSRDPLTGNYSLCPIPKEHLKDPDVRQIIEEKLGKPLDPDFF
jgi:CheY-like chemotaxis protein